MAPRGPNSVSRVGLRVDFTLDPMLTFMLCVCWICVVTSVLDLLTNTMFHHDGGSVLDLMFFFIVTLSLTFTLRLRFTHWPPLHHRPVLTLFDLLFH